MERFGSNSHHALRLRSLHDLPNHDCHASRQHSVFEAFLGTDFHKYWYTHRAFILAVTSILLIAPFIFPKKIEFIKYVSFLGTFAVTYLAVLIVIEYLATENESGPVPTKPEKISDIIFLIPTICFAYQCHMGSVPIYAGLQNRTLLKYGTIVGLVFIFVTIIYAMAGIFGLLTFGSKVNHDISRGYDAKRPEVITLNAAIFLAQIATYPLICFCGREAARNLLLTSINKDRNDLSSKEEFWYRIILSSIWLLTTTILAIFVPNVTVSIRAVGGLAALLIFFFPGLCLIFVLQQKRDALTSVGISGRILPAFWILAVFYVFFGIILFVGTTMKSVYEILSFMAEGLKSDSPTDRGSKDGLDSEVRPSQEGKEGLEGEDDEAKRGNGSGEYEFAGTNNIPGSISLFINTALGSGILNFPYAYKVAGGVAIGLTFQWIFGFLASPPHVILAYCSDKTKKNTYHECMSYCGRACKVIAAVVIVLYTFGACVTFQIILGDQSDNLFLAFLGSDFDTHWYSNRKFTIFWTAVVFVAPFVFPKKMEFIKYASFFGTASVIYMTLLIVVQFFVVKTNPEIPTSPNHWSDVIMLVPTMCFGYQCHLSSIPIYSCLRGRDFKTHIGIVAFIMTFVTITYTLAGTFGVLTFGINTPHNITSGYDASRIEVLLLSVAIAVAQVATYPMLCFCGREAMGILYLEAFRIPKESTVGRPELIRRVVISALWLLASTCIAAFVPNITVAIRMIGGLAGLIIFFFPGLCLFNVVQEDPDKKGFWPEKRRSKILLVASFFYMLFGFVLFIGTTTKAVMEIAKGSGTNYDRIPEVARV
ncbi:unnamed protein product [Notodromas monacha]|uniref:Amino acid transporter transmembrane domain-containing protein n=1 Tax=Notodromas monacha TaxID=399045 RepID=A0A7R9BI98_9CRUS|nr:unnamed protein product [Notodromas monacha]CAG0915147.1 unnamed protein product [Notodromas monacha]